SGSTGRIAEEIGQLFIEKGHKSYVAYGRINNSSKSEVIKIGEKKDLLFHLLKTRLTDRHGFGSKRATEDLITKIEEINPDAVGLHNIHGYYINIEVLFNFLKDFNKPVVWTLFDCWAFTGHCTYYDDINCKKWKTICYQCPKTSRYPASAFDNSKNNFLNKKKLFTSLKNLSIVVHSNWLKSEVEKSFLSSYPIYHIDSGIDIKIFKPFVSKQPKERNIILGVANVWDKRKGLNDFLTLREILPDNYDIVLVGLKDNINRPRGIKIIPRTEDVHQLAKLYSTADIFINPTYQDRSEEH